MTIAQAAFTSSLAWLQLSCARFLIKPFFLSCKQLKISGQENVPEKGPVLIVANHLSIFDPPLLLAACNRPMAYLAKQELFRVPLLKAFIRFSGAISLNRAHPGLGTFKEVKAVLDRNWALAIFIEGTRNKTPGILQQPHPGPAYIAKLDNVPILPVGITGTDKVCAQAEVRIGKLMTALADIDATTWMIMEKLSELTGFLLPDRRDAPDHKRRLRTGTGIAG